MYYLAVTDFDTGLQDFIRLMLIMIKQMPLPTGFDVAFCFFVCVGFFFGGGGAVCGVFFLGGVPVSIIILDSHITRKFLEKILSRILSKQMCL